MSANAVAVASSNVGLDEPESDYQEIDKLIELGINAGDLKK